MAQKKNKKAKPPEFFENLRNAVKRNLRATFLVSITAFLLFVMVRAFLYHSGYFTLRKVRTESLFLDQKSVSSINDQILKAYGGRNIFSVPLKGISQSLKRIYPDSKDISASLWLPDRLNVAVRFRRPVALVHDSKLYPIDDEGVVIPSVGVAYIKDLPVIEGAGIRYDDRKGKNNSLAKVKLALDLLKEIRASRYLAEYGTVSINTSNTSNISYRMKNGIEVFAGSENFGGRLDMLEGTLRDPRIDKDKIKYIDVSTQDIVIGPKA
jgi:cell division septal protein FtsQ